MPVQFHSIKNSKTDFMLKAGKTPLYIDQNKVSEFMIAQFQEITESRNTNSTNLHLNYVTI